MKLRGERGQQGGARIQSNRGAVERPAIEIRCHATGLPQDTQRPGQVEGPHRGRRHLECDPTGGGVAEIQRGGAELPDFLRPRQDGCRPLAGIGAGRGIDLDQRDRPPVEGWGRRAQRLTLVKGPTAGVGVELLAAHQVLHVAEPNISKSVTLRDGQHDGIVWQPHFGVHTAVQGVDQHQRRATELALAELLRDQPEPKTAAIRLLQVPQHDLFSELIEVNRLIAAGPDPLTVLGQAWDQWDARHYLFLATHGYAANGDARNLIAFFPLYPALIGALAAIGLPARTAALLISNVAGVAAAILLYEIARHDDRERAAFRAAAFFTVFPTAYFLLVGYTEALFCALAFGSVLA